MGRLANLPSLFITTTDDPLVKLKIICHGEEKLLLVPQEDQSLTSATSSPDVLPLGNPSAGRDYTGVIHGQ